MYIYKYTYPNLLTFTYICRVIFQNHKRLCCRSLEAFDFLGKTRSFQMCAPAVYQSISRRETRPGGPV